MRRQVAASWLEVAVDISFSRHVAQVGRISYVLYLPPICIDCIILDNVDHIRQRLAIYDELMVVVSRELDYAEVCAFWHGVEHLDGGTKIVLTYANGIRAVTRQDADL